jgi:zinc protease
MEATMSIRSLPARRIGRPFAFIVLAATALAGPLSAQVERPDQIEYPTLSTIAIPSPERIALSNGMIVYFLEDHELPLVSVQVRIRTGTRYDPPEKAGLADLTATVMRTGGAGDRSGAELDQFLEDRAANLSVSMGNSVGFAQLSVLTEHLHDVFPVLADLLMSPGFEEDKIEEAKVQERSAISRRNDSPGGVAAREFNKLVYGVVSPYARQTEYGTIDAITRADIVAFHRRYFHPNHMIIGMTGDFERDEMLALIEREFGEWEPVQVALSEEFLIESADPTKIYYIEKTDVTQSNFRLGHLGTTVDDPDYFAVEVMNTIFGEGFASRLFNVIRSEKGLAYAIWGSVGTSYAYPGVFQVGGSTKFESTGEALVAAIAEIRRMKEGTVTDDELAYAKESYLNSFIFNFDTPEEIVGRQMLYEYYGYPADFLQASRDRIEAVTREDVRRAAQRMLHPDNLIILCVGDASKFDKPLSELGDVVSIDITIPGSE